MNNVISSLHGPESEYSEGSKIHASAKISQSTLPLKKRMRYPCWHCINWEKEVYTGKTNYIPVEEALSLSSSIKKYGCQRKEIVFSRVVSTKSMATKTRGNLRKTTTQISNSFPEKRTVEYSLGSTRYMKPHNFSNIKITERAKNKYNHLKVKCSPISLVFITCSNLSSSYIFIHQNFHFLSHTLINFLKNNAIDIASLESILSFKIVISLTPSIYANLS